MKKRLLSLLLILCLCAALLPVAVFAEDNVTTVKTEDELKEAIAKGGAIQLGADITLDHNAGLAFLQIIYDDVTLDLNGHILKADTKTDGKFMIDVRYIHLTLIDSQPDATHDPEIKVGNEIIVVSNFTPVPRHGYRFGINQPGKWREILNTDSMHYHGSNTGNGGAVHSDEIASHGRQHSLSLTLPPLATIWLVREG